MPSYFSTSCIVFLNIRTFIDQCLWNEIRNFSLFLKLLFTLLAFFLSMIIFYQFWINMQIRQWKKWEDSIRNEPISRRNGDIFMKSLIVVYLSLFNSFKQNLYHASAESVPELAERKETLHWRKSAIVSWMVSLITRCID